VVADGIRGVALAPGRLESRRVVGLDVAAIYAKTSELDGVSVSGYNRVRGAQRGLALGRYNSTAELHGAQLGILNRAQNNHGLLRLLPLLNVHG
jgi:hypothetical protein